MEQQSSSLEEIIMHRAMEESHLHYGGQGPAKNPLEIMIDQELDEEYARRDREAAEVLHAILSFASEGINVPGVIYKWHRITRRIKSDETLTYTKANKADKIPWSFVEIRKEDGKLVNRYEPARVKSIYKPRPGKKEASPAAEIQILTIEYESAALRVGTRILSLAALAGVNQIREMSGQGVASKLGVTRQAVSLTNKAMEAKIKEATGGKAGARGLRHKADPRKGKTLDQINRTE